MNLTSIQITSGTVLVFKEDSSSSMVRWRDGKRWSPSRPQGQFLLYREVEANSKPYTHRESELSTRFTNMSLRGQCRFIPNGLAKRTIGLIGSDGNRYRVICYFQPADAERFYEDCRPEVLQQSTQTLNMPSQLPQFAEYNITKNQTTAATSSRAVYNETTPDSQPTTSETQSRPNQSTSAYRTTSPPLRLHINHQTPYSRPVQNPSPISIAASRPLKSSLPLPPFQTSDPRTFIQGANAYHPMFQVTDIPGISRSGKTCPCGGLGIRKPHNYFWNDPNWYERSIHLAPLCNGKGGC
ncbi:UNVERIFIED_CONTAM: hypothetical protein HDU68_008342 [Siphonaria sp. JEL0065]|nr:hypothetical protein HDU68_008342 [Siphonaria sp. JEL0065]